MAITVELDLDLLALDEALEWLKPRSPHKHRVVVLRFLGALTYANTLDGVTNVWRRPLNGNPPKPLTFFKTVIITLFDWSHDGAWLACTHKANYEDVILISDFK
jgi:hypothetical protein